MQIIGDYGTSMLSNDKPKEIPSIVPRETLFSSKILKPNDFGGTSACGTRIQNGLGLSAARVNRTQINQPS
jgi:hypothetical protein